MPSSFSHLLRGSSILPFQRGEPHASRFWGTKSHRRLVIAVSKTQVISQVLRSVLRSHYYPCGVGFGTHLPPPPAVSNQSRTDYTPSFRGCQYLVAIFFFNTIECVF